MKKFATLNELAKFDRHIKWVNAAGKMALISLAWCRVATNIQFLKKKTTCYLWGTIKQSLTKWVMPVEHLCMYYIRYLFTICLFH